GERSYIGRAARAGEDGSVAIEPAFERGIACDRIVPQSRNLQLGVFIEIRDDGAQPVRLRGRDGVSRIADHMDQRPGSGLETGGVDLNADLELPMVPDLGRPAHLEGADLAA